MITHVSESNPKSDLWWPNDYTCQPWVDPKIKIINSRQVYSMVKKNYGLIKDGYYVQMDEDEN